MWYPYHGVGWGWIISMGLMMVLFWGGMIVLGAWAFRSLFGGSARRASDRAEIEGQNRPSSDSALEIVRERYARGEISKAEYEQLRDDLST